MTATVFYDSANEIALLTNTFVNGAGTPADPASVSCTVTEPSGAAVTHTYAGTLPADVIKISTGTYTVAVPCSPQATGVDGLWSAAWTGTGAVSDVQPATWRVLPLAIAQYAYTGLEEVRDRLSIEDDSDDYAIQNAILASAGWINEYTGRHFFRVTETRTYQPGDIWLLEIDDLVSVTQLAVDQDGDGVYEDLWTQGTDYQLRFGRGNYNQRASGWSRPYRQVQAVNSGKTFPFTWPFTPLDRVQITGTWGWPAVPYGVSEANRILAADAFRMKDAPFGIAGGSDLGMVRVQANPMVVENLRFFINGRRKVGI